MDIDIAVLEGSVHYTLKFYATDAVELADWYIAQPITSCADRKLDNMVTLRVPADRVPHLKVGVNYIVV